MLSGQSVDSITYPSDAVSEITALASSAQKQYVSESWNTHNGLPVNNINDVYQTPDGYLWLATFSGLIRFDGVRFVEFNSGNTENLPSNRILLIQGGEGNTFWLTTEQEDLIHVDNGVFTRFDVIDEWQKHFVTPKKFSDGTWVGSVGGLYSFDGANLTPARADLFGELIITNILYSKGNDLWIVSDAGKAFRFPDGDIHSEPIVIEVPVQSPTLIEDERGRIWVGEWQLGFIENDLYMPVEISRDYLAMQNTLAPLIFSFIETPDSQILVSTQLGLMKIDDNDQLVEIDISSPDEYAPIASIFGNALTSCPDGSVWSFSKNRVYKNGVHEFVAAQEVESIYCDLEQNLWFTSYRSGLMRYRLSLFESITFDHSDNNFYGIYADSYNGLWIGKMFGELNRIDSQGNLERYKTPRGWAATSALIELSDGSFIVGNQRCRPENRTANGGCNTFQLIDELEEKSIYALYEDRELNLWSGTLNGVIRFKGDESGEFTVDLKEGSLPVRFFLEADDGAIWYATNGDGVVKFKDGNSDKYGIKNGLSSNNIRWLFQDEYGFIWVASEDRGLNRIDPTSGEIVIITSSHGLYDDGLHTMLPDNSGRMWFSTNRGIFWVNFSDLREFADGHRNRIYSTAYTERDGMRNREANGGFQNSGMKTEDGRLWFTTQEEILIINPDEISVSHPLPGVVIESAVSDGTSLLDDNGGIIISPDQRSFSITFSSPVFTAPERVRFRYMLAGFDRDWVDAINRREAIYTNVPAGEYEFRVVAYIDSEYSETKQTIASVIITPTFIETAWFQAIIILLLLLFIGGGYQVRVRQLLRKEKKLATLVDERTEALRSEKKVTEAQAEQLKKVSLEKDRFFANISHEFRTPLTLTIGPLKDLKNGRYGSLTPEVHQQVELSLRNSKRLLRLVGQLMDLARLEARKFELNKQAGNLNSYLHTVAEPFNIAADQKGIEFSTNFPEDPVFLEFDPGHFDKIIANLLSNAFKFTSSAGFVTLKLERKDSSAVITVEDNGRGMSEEHLPRLFDRFYQVQKSEMEPGTGIGLSLVKELTELHGGSIEVKSIPGTGSTFTVKIPLIFTAGSVVFAPEETDLLYSPEVELEHLPTVLNDSGDNSNEAKEAFQKTILVVDDHAEIRLYLRQHLQDDYIVIEAASGREALKHVDSSLPDLILSDVMMPDGDGIELLKKIRNNPETSFIPIILLTARAEAEDKLAGLDIGANDYITKPFNIKELAARINSIFSQQNRIKHHFSKERASDIKVKIHHDTVEKKSVDDTFLDMVKHEIQLNLAEENFTVEDLALRLKQSRSNLHRRLVKLTGETPSAMIRRIRLELGAQLLKQKAGTVSEVAYSTGFKSLAHFSRAFRAQFKMTPTEYIESKS